MDKLEEFKIFVRSHPKLKDEVIDGKYTWQQIYELYDLYGSDHSIFKEYKDKEEKEEKVNVEENNSSSLSGFSLNDIMKVVQGIDSDKLVSGLDSFQKFLGVLSTLVSNNSPKKESKPLPFYKRFDD